MVTNNGTLTTTRLEGCSDWYNNPQNRLLCSCFRTTDSQTLPDCTKQDSESCKYPYCLNQNSLCTQSDATKCSTLDNQKLYMCNGESIDKQGFVMYTYQYFPPEAVTSTIINVLLDNQPQKSNNIFKYIIIGVIILVIILIVIYIMMNAKKGKKIGKGTRRK